MNTMLIFLLLIGLLLFAFVLFSTQPKPIDNPLVNPYIAKKPLTDTEIDFYNLLSAALPEYRVLAQVQLSSFIKVDKSLIYANESYKWQNPISQQSVDYLICDQDFSIIAAIELDDKTHYSQDAIKRDTKKNTNLQAAKVRLIRWHAESMPSLEEIQFEVKRYLIDSPSDNLDQEEWRIERNDRFFEQSKILSNTSRIQQNTLLFKIIFFLISIAIIFIGFNQIAKNSLKLITNPITTMQSISEDIKNRNQDRLNASIEKQAIEKNKKIEERRIEIQQQQALNIKQDQLRAEAIKEQNLKEALWESRYKEKLDCTHKSVLDCGNDNIRARREFEAYWEVNKSKLLNENK
jgi:hypothetical protein